MSVKSKFFLFCESLLRVPPLFVIDEILRYNFGLGKKEYSQKQEATCITKPFYKFSLSVLLLSIVVLMLKTRNLVRLYSYFLCFLCLYINYIFPPLALLDNTSLFYANLGGRLLLSLLYFKGKKWSGCRRESGSISALDALMFSIFFISGLFRGKLSPELYFFTTFFLQLHLYSSLLTFTLSCSSGWREGELTRATYGLNHFLIVETSRLSLNGLFRIYWILKMGLDAQGAISCVGGSGGGEGSGGGIWRWEVGKSVIGSGSETLVGLISLTIIISSIAHLIGEILIWVLYNGGNTDRSLNRFGTISAILFFILSLQTGVTELEPEKRIDRLVKNIALLATALLHALHQILCPVLHGFRSFKSPQIRGVSLGLFFLLFSSICSATLVLNATISTWSLAVLALALEFKIKIIVSLLICTVVYLSQLVETPQFLSSLYIRVRGVVPKSFFRPFSQLSDELSGEDLVFYLKTISKVVEFLTGIFLFGNAVWIFLFESASLIRSLGMGIHAYFNIWLEGKKGYRVYCQRKTASKKIDSLKDATRGELYEKRNDFCAICFEGMESAKVTRCNHLFHAVCLRKWLYVQNTCPLCLKLMYSCKKVEEVENSPLPPHDDDELIVINEGEDGGDDGRSSEEEEEEESEFGDLTDYEDSLLREEEIVVNRSSDSQLSQLDISNRFIELS